jgi:hypothetical protein
VLVLLMGENYEVCQSDGLRWHDVYMTFHDDWFRHSSSIKGITSTIGEAVVLLLLIRGIYEVCL